ncbi:MAG TPA: tetratricopeptide repeat protein [Thermoanaerobaculia bacterium]|nr:tetratricopeptide repeat protein [Thermoanaerobaculia bacterium]
MRNDRDALRDRLGRCRWRGSRACLLVALLAFPAAGRQPAAEAVAAPARPPLAELPQPALETQEDAVRGQLTELRRQLDLLIADPSTPLPRLAEAFGRLGRLYFLYDLVDLASIALENAKLLAPNDHRWPYFLAAHQTFEGQLEEAIGNLERVLELRPNDLPTLVRLGDVHSKRGGVELAREFYERALALDEDVAAAHAGLGRLDLEAGQHQRAVDRVERALELQPDADELYHTLGMAYRGLGDVERAREALRKNKHGRVTFDDPLIESLGLENASAEAHIQMASDAMRRQELAKAVPYYESYLELKPDDVVALNNLGIALLGLDRWEEGMKTLRRAVEIDPNHRGAQYSLATALADLGRYDEALEHYRRAHEIDPAEKVIHADWATLLAKVGRVDEAIAELRSLLEEDPLQDYGRLKLGSVLVEAGRLEEAAQELRQVADSGGLQRPGRGEAHYHLGVVAERRGDAAKAREHYRRAIELAPGLAEAQRSWGVIRAREGALEEAAGAFARAVELEPRNERYRFELSMALLLGEREAEARKALEEALREFPTAINLRHLLARLLASASDPAVRDGERAVELAQGVVERALTLDHAETLAMALAEIGRYDEAAAWQRRVVRQAGDEGEAGGPAHAARLERLERYERGEPARTPWRG